MDVEQIEAILADSQVEGEFVLVSRQPSAVSSQLQRCLRRIRRADGRPDGSPSRGPRFATNQVGVRGIERRMKEG